MQKSKFILSLLIGLGVILTLMPFFAAAQPADTIPVINITLPSVFDFSTIGKAFATLSIVGTSILTIISGYWTKGSQLLSKFIPTTSRRVFIVGVFSAILTNFIFGFNKDAINLLFSVLIGGVSGLGIYDVALKAEKQ